MIVVGFVDKLEPGLNLVYWYWSQPHYNECHILIYFAYAVCRLFCQTCVNFPWHSSILPCLVFYFRQRASEYPLHGYSQCIGSRVVLAVAVCAAVLRKGDTIQWSQSVHSHSYSGWLQWCFCHFHAACDRGWRSMWNKLTLRCVFFNKSRKNILCIV